MTSCIPCRREPLQSVAYTYDGTLEGLLSAVFATYANHEQPEDVAPETALMPRLGQSVVHIPTNQQHAQRVRRGIVRACGQAGFESVTYASLSDDPGAGTAVYRFIRYAMQQDRPADCAHCGRRSACKHPGGCSQQSAQSRASIMADTMQPEVLQLEKLAKSVENERHLLTQFLRFEHLENGVWLARCAPKANVVPLLMDWFCGRFNTQPFIIYDERHHLAGVHTERGWHLVSTETLNVPARSAEEEGMQHAWRQFYRAVSTEARYHPELRVQFMPKRFWDHLTEMQDDRLLQQTRELPPQEASPKPARQLKGQLGLAGHATAETAARNQRKAPMPVTPKEASI